MIVATLNGVGAPSRPGSIPERGLHGILDKMIPNQKSLPADS